MCVCLHSSLSVCLFVCACICKYARMRCLQACLRACLLVCFFVCLSVPLSLSVLLSLGAQKLKSVCLFRFSCFIYVCKSLCVCAQRVVCSSIDEKRGQFRSSQETIATHMYVSCLAASLTLQLCYSQRHSRYFGVPDGERIFGRA